MPVALLWIKAITEEIVEFLSRDLWRAVALILLAVLALVWVYASVLDGRLDRIKAQADADVAAARADVGIVVAANEEWTSAALALQNSLAHCQAQWVDVQAAAATALAAADEEKRRAAADAAAWEAKWEARNATCSAALASLDDACPELRDY